MNAHGAIERTRTALTPKSTVEPTGRRGGRRRRVVLGAVVLVMALPVVNLFWESVAAAATPALVQSAAGQNSGGAGATVGVTATLSSTCTTGDTLIAMVTVAQNGA